MLDEKIIYYIDEVERGIRENYIPPVTFEINPCNRCMLRCTFCIHASHMNSQLIPLPTYFNLVRTLRGSGVRSLTFTGGGEPLLHPNFLAMADFALSLGFQIGLVTNGVLLHTILNPEAYTFIRVSLDAATPATYTAIKGFDLFDRVTANIASIASKTTLGISYVVCAENKHELTLASALAKHLNAAYIQFKPSWTNSTGYTDYTPPTSDGVIDTRRYRAYDLTPCTIASLVGVVSADCGVYYCCQHKGEPPYLLGTLETGNEVLDIWRRRKTFRPNLSDCPHCRYMNYAHAYERIRHNHLIKHRNFL